MSDGNRAGRRSMPSDRGHRPVRALLRGLDLLSAIGRGVTTVPGLSAATGLNRTSVYRLLATLEDGGYVARAPADGRYRLTPRALELSAGAQPSDALIDAATPVLRDLTTKLKWPANLAKFQDGRMLVLISTHTLPTNFHHRDMTGELIPMSSSIGCSYLAHVDPAEAEMITNRLAASDHPLDSWIHDRVRVLRLLRTTRIQRYALAYDQVEPGLSGLALPVRHHGQVVGSVNIVTPTAMPRADVLGHNLAALGKAVRRIEATIADEDLISDATR